MHRTQRHDRRGIGHDLSLWLLLLSVCLLTALFAGCEPAPKPQVEISEVVSSNGQSYEHPVYGAVDWIELHNAGASPVSLNGWFLTDKYDALSADCCLPAITLPPDGYCVIFADKEMAEAGTLCLPFGLSKSGESLYLFDADGEQAAELKVPALEKDVSWARRPDGTYGYCLIPTPEAPNQGEILDAMPAAAEEPLPNETFRGNGPLEISEVVSSNGVSLLEKPYGAVDWIELHNRSAEALSLKGWYLSDRNAITDGSCALPDVTVPADGYFVILADTEGARLGDRCLPFSIRKTGETLYLFDPSGQWAAILTVPALEKDVSWALDAAGSYGYCLFPTPGQANGTEILAELPQAPVPRDQIIGRRSPVQLSINEICSAPLGEDRDWIELYNPTDAPVDAAGFFLTDSTGNITKGVLPALTVPARGYAVVPLGPGTDPAQGIAAFSLSADGEPLYLFDDELGLIDMAEVPPLQEGLVYARREDLTFGYCGVPTPGAANTAGIYDEPLRTMAADAPIHINEGLFKNRYSAIDAYGDRSDWVELVNRSSAACSLSGYYLSDDRNDLRKWPLPARTLAPGEYLLVFLSGRDSVGQEIHAPFSVSEKDEGCFLYRAAELDVELLPCPKDLPQNLSVGLDAAGQLLYYAYPTPGYANAQSFSGPLPASIFPAGAIFISEVSAGGADGDWVELYNRSDKTVKLNGWHLSDDDMNLQKKSLDGLSLKPGGYALVPVKTKGGEALFSIARAGETLLLSDGKGAVLDVFASGALQKDRTSGRVESSPEAGRVFFETPTPGKQNSQRHLDGYAAKPCFSDTALYHDQSFPLTMTVSLPDTVIHYTLDGSAPTAQSPVYNGPLTIDRNAIVRAVGMAAGRLSSEETVMTYLFRQPHTLPVVCLAADPERWTKLTRAPGVKDGLEEQPAFVTYYEADGTLGTIFPAGISPRGNASLGYPQKSLSVHLRGAYGQSAVSYPFWGENTGLSYSFLILRNGSQDIRGARLRDSFASRASENLRVMTVWTRPVILYINGAYYGIMDLNEGMNQDYLRTHYGVDPDTVNMVQRNDHAKRGSAKGYVDLRQYAARKNMADDQVYAAFCQMMDMDAFIDYLVAQSFFGNYDIHNQNWWNAGDSIRWQPILYDVDRCLNETSANSNVLGMYFNSSGVVHNQLGDKILMEIPCGLKKNASWRQRFVERYAELLCTEFREDRLLALLDEMAAALRPEMAEHTARWKMPDSVSAWEKNVGIMRQCISQRYAAVAGQIKRQFSLSDAEWNALMAKYGGR